MSNQNPYAECAEAPIQSNLKLILPTVLARTGMNVAQSVGVSPLVGAAIGGAVGGVILAMQDLKDQTPSDTYTDRY